MHKLQSSKDQKQKVVSKHAELLGKLCKDCQKIFSDYYNIDTYVTDIKNALESIDKSNAQMSANSSKMEEIRNRVQVLEQKQDKARGKIKLLTEEFNKTNQKLQSITTDMRIVESELRKAEDTANPYVELLEKSKADIKGETD